MSTTITSKCDGCGCVLRDDTAETAEREVSVQMSGDLPPKVSVLASSIDPHEDGRQMYRWRSAGWDLCVPCAGPVYAWLVARLGKSPHDDLGEVMP